jgi:hypothetical protein
LALALGIDLGGVEVRQLLAGLGLDAQLGGFVAGPLAEAGQR